MKILGCFALVVSAKAASVGLVVIVVASVADASTAAAEQSYWVGTVEEAFHLFDCQ